MKILIACEESQVVCKAFREKGHEAYSCDILDCSGGHPEWHLKTDVLKILNGMPICLNCGKMCVYDYNSFWCDECEKLWPLKFWAKFQKWDMMIAFPPCTHLAVSGAAWFKEKRKDGRQQEGINFFMALTKTEIPKWCIENPVGIMSNIYRKPDQIIQPYYFGDEAQKTTCLWLNNLQPLFHAEKPDLFNDKITHVNKGEFIEFDSGKRMAKWYALLRRDENRAKIRSRTFPSIAQAMAEQWG